jgi:diguanylate cyclase (GGDEF)-like protein/PAS domain S-box-containing protein
MVDRTELLESALDSLQEGVALFGMEGEIAFWNQAAEETTGYPGVDVMGRGIPHGLEPLAPENALQREWRPAAGMQLSRGMLVKARHKLGHEMQIMARTRPLRDVLGERIGTAVVFHPAESLDALPHGRCSEDGAAVASQADFEEHIRGEFENCADGTLPFGVLWIKVDQAEALLKSHGAGACVAMLDKMEHALAAGLRPTEAMGRWGDGEFLTISHERTPDMLANHARVLTGLARTADFKWWGDRITLTVSIGAAQACEPGGESLAQLLERAQKAMETSVRAGGNCATLARGGVECLRS